MNNFIYIGTELEFPAGKKVERRLINIAAISSVVIVDDDLTINLLDGDHFKFSVKKHRRLVSFLAATDFPHTKEFGVHGLWEKELAESCPDIIEKKLFFKNLLRNY